MRISTASFYEQSQQAMGTLQAKLVRVQQQIASGSKIMKASDDPLGATRALATSQSIALQAQYAASRTQATQSLSMEENALQSVTTVLQSARTLVIQAGNGALTDADRGAIATALEASMDQLQGLANSDDGNGQYLFAGFASGSQPFTRGADGTMGYNGNEGQRQMQVDVSRKMSATDDGRSIFLSVPSSAGYVSSAPLTNTGGGVLGSTTIKNAGDVNFGKDFVISFPTPDTWRVDTAAVPPEEIVADSAFTPGMTLEFGGLQLSIKGAPEAGDTFEVFTPRKAGADVFAAFADIISVLRMPRDNAGPTAEARLLNALGTANRKLTNAHDNVLTVRASVGSRLQELDALEATGSARTLSDQLSLSDLQDLDYATAITQFQQRQTALQASQQTYVKLQQIALFNYL
jgi:flagellar hook-associated protein 3 FlgL